MKRLFTTSRAFALFMALGVFQFSGCGGGGQDAAKPASGPAVAEKEATPRCQTHWRRAAHVQPPLLRGPETGA